MNVSLGEAAELMSDARTIVITAHVHPDGDAIGSSLGLMHFCEVRAKRYRFSSMMISRQYLIYCGI